MVTVGLDEDTIDTLTGALLRMKTVLIQEAHAARRGAEPPDRPALGETAVTLRETEAAHHEAETTELA